MDRNYESGRAQAILSFLDAASTGMGSTIRFEASHYPWGKPSNGADTGRNFGYVIYVPWSPLKEFFLGIGGDAEPVVAEQYPTGELRVVGSDRVMRHIEKGAQRLMR